MKIHLYPASGHIHPYPTGEDIADPDTLPFRVWIPERNFLVLGYSQEPEREFNLDAVGKHDIPVYKRKGGGGAVLLSPGNVCVALRFPRKPGFGIAEYFSAANGMIRAALRDALSLDLEPRGISDLAFEERKVLGSSLQLTRNSAVYLASILVSVDRVLLDELLRHPSREPDYRGGRVHHDFVRNLNEIPGLESLTPERVTEILRAYFPAAIAAPA